MMSGWRGMETKFIAIIYPFIHSQFNIIIGCRGEEIHLPPHRTAHHLLAPAALFIGHLPAAACPRPDQIITSPPPPPSSTATPGNSQIGSGSPEIDDASRRRPRPGPRAGAGARLPGQPHVLHHHRLLLPGIGVAPARALERRAQLRRRRCGRRAGVRAAPLCQPAAEGGAGEDVHVARERRQRRHQEGPGAHRPRRLPRRRRRGQRRGRRRRGRRRWPQEAPALQGPGRRPRGVLQDAQHAQPQAEDGAGEPAGAAAAAGGGVVPEPPRPHQAEADGGGLRVHEAVVRAARRAEQAPREGGGRAPRAQGRARLARPAGLPRRHAHHVPLLPPRRRHHRRRHAAPAASAVPSQVQRAARRQRPAQPLPVLPRRQRRRRPVRQAAGRVERRRAAARHQRALLRRDLAAGVQSKRLIRRFQAAVDWVNQSINWQISQSIATRRFDLVWIAVISSASDGWFGFG